MHCQIWWNIPPLGQPSGVFGCTFNYLYNNVYFGKPKIKFGHSIHGTFMVWLTKIFWATKLNILGNQNKYFGQPK